MSESRRVAYAFEPPAFGKLTEIVSGFLWTRMPLPFALDHVNVWILDEGDAWVVFDCGMNTPETVEIWHKLLSGPLKGKPVRELIATHGHGDHTGYSRAFCELTGAPLRMTRGEWSGATLRRATGDDAIRNDAGGFYANNGFPPAELEKVARQREQMKTIAPAPPDGYIRIIHGQTLTFGGGDWKVATSGGHAPEHPVFYSLDRPLLIVGDQVLPRISPHIGVQIHEPDEDPLGEFLAFLQGLAHIDDDVLILPSHEAPYFGIGRRIAQLLDHHATRLDQVEATAREPRTAFEIAGTVFERAMKRGQAHHAFTETLSHINHLRVQGRLLQTMAQDGMIRHVAAHPAFQPRAAQDA